MKFAKAPHHFFRKLAEKEIKRVVFQRYFGDSKLIGLAFSKVYRWIGEVRKPCVPFGNIHGCGNVFLLKSVRKDDESEQHLHENNISHPICVCNHDIKSKYHKSPKPKRLKRFSAVTDFSLPSSTSPNFCTKKLSHCTHLVLTRKTIERCQNEWHALSSSVVHLIQTIEKSYTHTFQVEYYIHIPVMAQRQTLTQTHASIFRCSLTRKPLTGVRQQSWMHVALDGELLVIRPLLGGWAPTQ